MSNQLPSERCVYDRFVYDRVQIGWSANGREVDVLDDSGEMWVVRYSWGEADVQAIDATGEPTEFAGKHQRIHRLLVMPIYMLRPHVEQETSPSPARLSTEGTGL